MITQTQGLSITSLDELVVSQAQFNEFMNDADRMLHPIGALYTSTVRILRHASWLAEQKATLTKQEYKELLRKYNWEGEEKAHLKIHEAFGTFAPYQLAQIEPRTIFVIALNHKKYQSVITQMQTLRIITQDKVRSLMKQCHKARAKKEEETPTIWRIMPDGKRACVIAPIYNQSVGVILEEIVKKEGRSPQSIVEEALIAYHESKYGSPVSEDATLEVEVVDVVEDEAAPVVNVVDSNEVAPHVEEAALNNSVASWDENVVVIEELTETEVSDYNEECDEDDNSQHTWSFELDEEDDVELAPVDLLIQALQTASSWQEINEALKNNEEHKQEAWDALTPVERKRIIELTPPTVTRLSNAKRNGLIMDYRVEREGVYQVKQNGNLFWDIVFEYRVEEYFARL